MQMIEHAAQLAVRNYIEACRVSDPHDPSRECDVREAFAIADVHWIAGVVDAAMHAKPVLFHDPDDRQLYQSGRDYENAAEFVRAMRAANIDPSEWTGKFLASFEDWH